MIQGLTPVEEILTREQLPEFFNARDHIRAILRSRSTAISAREIELQWLLDHPQVLEANAGKWVALKGQEVVSSNCELSHVLEQVKQRGINKPILFYVPSNPKEYLLGISNQTKQ